MKYIGMDAHSKECFFVVLGKSGRVLRRARVETKENEIRTENFKCPWKEAAELLGIPKEWRFCPSGHAAFAESMQKTLNPNVSYKMPKSMPMGDDVCEEITAF